MQQNYSITQLKDKILDSNARSVFIDAHPKNSVNKIDLISLSKLARDLDPKQITNKLLLKCLAYQTS